MSDISSYLDTIESAIYGEDMRSAIHDAIEMCGSDIDVIENFLTPYEEHEASSTIESAYYTFRDGVLTQGTVEGYTCTAYFGLDLTETWAVTAVCNNTSVPVVVICPNGAGDARSDCAVISATATGEIEKGLEFNQESTGYSERYGIVYVNSYLNAPTLYKRATSVYTKDETDAAIEEAITNVVNTAY